VEFRVGEEQAGMRLDVAVASADPDLSRTLARALIDGGQVRVGGNVCKPAYRLVPGDVVVVTVEPPPSLSAAPEALPLQVVYQDADMAVIDKPAGLVVHPAPGHPGGTLANGLVGMFPQSAGVGGEERPGIVHRLDKDTSGLIAVALSPAGQMSLQAQIADRSAERRYLALVSGTMSPVEGVIEAPIGRDERHRKRMAVHGAAARPARTRYRVVRICSGYTLLEAKLDTGRTHQIRVHLAAIGHPVAGDSVYGGPTVPNLDRQFLHAYRLALRIPSTGERLTFAADLPADLRSVLDQLGCGAPELP
jgi:23S rRNA pseudouridine1911/1915/1917 synthase